MKKLLLLLLAILTVFIACILIMPEAQLSPVSAAAPAEVLTEAPTPAPTRDPAQWATPEPELPLPYLSRDSSTGEYTKLPEPGSSANGSVLAEDAQLKVTLLRTRYQTQATQYELDLLIENRTEKPLFLEAGELAVVDGYTYFCFSNADIPALAQHEITLYVFAEEFWNAGISTPQELKFSLSIYDSSAPDYPYLDTYYFAVYPSGLSAEQVQVKSIWDMGFAGVEYTDDFAGVSFRILDSKLTEDRSFYQIDLVLENSSGEYRSYTWEGTTVNGVETDPHWNIGVPAGAKIYTHIYLDMDELRAKGVDEPDEIGYSFIVSNGEGPLTANYMYYRPAKG